MKRDAVIVDMDGTLANNKGRDWKAYELCGNDLPIESTIARVQELYDEGLVMIVMSGRPDSCIAETVGWLEKYCVPFDHIFMRVTGDYRADDIIKRELYEQGVEPFFNVVKVLDDRPKVIRMWRELGFDVEDVGDGIEF